MKNLPRFLCRHSRDPFGIILSSCLTFNKYDVPYPLWAISDNEVTLLRAVLWQSRFALTWCREQNILNHPKLNCDYSLLRWLRHTCSAPPPKTYDCVFCEQSMDRWAVEIGRYCRYICYSGNREHIPNTMTLQPYQSSSFGPCGKILAFYIGHWSLVYSVLFLRWIKYIGSCMRFNWVRVCIPRWK